MLRTYVTKGLALCGENYLDILSRSLAREVGKFKRQKATGASLHFEVHT